MPTDGFTTVFSKLTFYSWVFTFHPLHCHFLYFPVQNVREVVWMGDTGTGSDEA